jgi:hypothetical protein
MLLPYRDMGLWPDKDIDPSDREIQASVHNQSGKQAIPGTDIEHAGIPGQNIPQELCQDAVAPAVNIRPVDAFNQAWHERLVR